MLTCTLTGVIAMVDMLLQKQSIYLEFTKVFSRDENMNILLYLFWWVAGLVWAAVTDYRFRKAKRGSQT
ncbi:hypothetical protein D3C76_1793000 [compost metagenome]